MVRELPGAQQIPELPGKPEMPETPRFRPVQAGSAVRGSGRFGSILVDRDDVARSQRYGTRCEEKVQSYSQVMTRVVRLRSHDAADSTRLPVGLAKALA